MIGGGGAGLAKGVAGFAKSGAGAGSGSVFATLAAGAAQPQCSAVQSTAASTAGIFLFKEFRNLNRALLPRIELGV